MERGRLQDTRMASMGMKTRKKEYSLQYLH